MKEPVCRSKIVYHKSIDFQPLLLRVVIKKVRSRITPLRTLHFQDMLFMGLHPLRLLQPQSMKHQ